jgi:hypothetical protein
MNNDGVKKKKTGGKKQGISKNGLVDIYTNYVIFRNVEIFRIFFQVTKFCEGKYEIFKNFLFVNINISSLINYSTNMCGSCQRYYM